MASCPECSNEISEGAQVCIHCGAKFNSDNVGADEISTNNAKAEGTEAGPTATGAAKPPPHDADNKAGGVPRAPAKNLKSTMKPQMRTMGKNKRPAEAVNRKYPANDPAPGSPPESAPNARGVSDNPGGGGTPEQIDSRSKWLQAQDKIKQELEALKGKISTGFSLDTSLDLNEDEDIFELENEEMQTIKDASISLTPLKRPLTPEEEEKKQELLVEIRDLKAEGYDTTRLERIVEVDPTSAWQEFVKYMDDIDTLSKLRKRYSELDTTGFENESESIRSNLDNPDLTNQIERELDSLEKQISMGASEIDQGGLRELIEAGKEAFKNNEFQKALNFYMSALKIDPNNREVEFYRKKTEAKLQAFSTINEVPPPDTYAPPIEPIYQAPPQTPMPQVAPAPTPAPAPAVPRPAAGPASQRKIKVRPKTGGPGLQSKAPKVLPTMKSQIPTGANAEVKTPLSVSMTPKLPVNRNVSRPGSTQKTHLVKSKRVAMKKPLPTATPKPSAAPAPQVAPAPASSNPTEVEALGFNAIINKDYEKALGYYEQVLALDPNFPGAAIQRDKCLQELGRK